MVLSVGMLVVRFINLDPPTRMFTHSFFDISSHTYLCLHGCRFYIVFIFCNVWPVITFGLELAFRMCVVTTTFVVFTLSAMQSPLFTTFFFKILLEWQIRETISAITYVTLHFWFCEAYIHMLSLAEIVLTTHHLHSSSVRSFWMSIWRLKIYKIVNQQVFLPPWAGGWLCDLRYTPQRRGLR